MTAKLVGGVLSRPICVWLSEGDHEKLDAIAKAHGVKISTYLRGIVVDVIAEETSKSVEVRPKLAVAR